MNIYQILDNTFLTNNITISLQRRRIKSTSTQYTRYIQYNTRTEKSKCWTVTETYLQINLSLRTCEVIANPIIAQTICAEQSIRASVTLTILERHELIIFFILYLIQWFVIRALFLFCFSGIFMLNNQQTPTDGYKDEKREKKENNLKCETQNERTTLERSTGTTDKWQNGKIGHFHWFKWYKWWCIASDKIY